MNCLSHFVLAVLLPATVFAASAPAKPNIVFILADDLGYGDLGCYGQKEIQTPNIDRLAAEGMRFTQFYAGASVCAPSRCVLMTGRHTGHCRVRGNAPLTQRARQTLTRDDVTVAALLKQAGYATALVGKWGLGMDDMPGRPLEQGFDFFFGYLDQVHAHNYFPDTLWRNREKVTLPNEVRPIPVGNSGDWGTGGIATKRVAYSPKLMLDEALQFIEQNKSRPFFLYFATTIPHANNEAAKELGNGAEVPDLGLYEGKPWPTPEKGYAAMIGCLDRQVGAILQRLEQLGLDENTLVIFTSDNGPELRQFTGYDTEFFKSAGNYRGFKRDNYEGGIRVPFIARWPKSIKPGSVSRHVGYFGDFLATATELAGAKTPAGLDSISFAPALLNRAGEQARHDFLYWEYHAGNASTQAALMDGRWKGVRQLRNAGLELYDLVADAGETRNVAAQHAGIAAKVAAYLTTARTNPPNWPLRELPAAVKTAEKRAESIKVTRSIHVDVPTQAGSAQVAGISYASIKKPVLMESIGLPEGAFIRRSEDNGKTWTKCETWKVSEPIQGDRTLQRDLPEFFLDPENGWMFRVFNVSESIRGVVPWDPKSPVMATRKIFIQISKDEGKTWGEPRQLIQSGPQYDATHWAEGFWHGKNSAAVEGAHIIKLKDGTILMPFWAFKLHENGSIRSPRTGWVVQVSGCFLGRWRADGSGIDWEMSNVVSLPPKYSNDGADEPSVDYLPDGRLMMILRARVCKGSKTELPGLKYFSVSGDEGRTWREGSPLLYDDGSYPYSPACLGNVFRSKHNGRFYLITNINPGPGQNCDPRTTLQIAQIDPKTLCLVKNSVTPLETRSGDQPLSIRFSNYRWYEDRETRNIVLFMTACPGDVGRSLTCGCPGQSFRYVIRLPAP